MIRPRRTRRVAGAAVWTVTAAAKARIVKAALTFWPGSVYPGNYPGGQP